MVYEKGRISICIDLELIKRLDKIKQYPRWKKNRSALIEHMLLEVLEGEFNADKKN